MTIREGTDFVLLEIPPRYVPFMPNGLAHVEMILRREGINSQVVDANIIVYHRYHQKRLLEQVALQVLPSGTVMPSDPWDNAVIDIFGTEEVVDYFWQDIKELTDAIIIASPKVVGLSLNAHNSKLSSKIIAAIRKSLPECCIVVGGYLCYTEETGPKFFKDYDYMVIGEAEISFPPLARALVRGERPKDMPGIISRWDADPGRPIHIQRPADLDAIGWPTYDWTDINIYRSFDGNKLVPICGSRGCSWSRCRFCHERYAYRLRSPESVVAELEYFVERGFRSFHFNESDVNGDPQNLYNICTEIIDRNIQVRLMGQLRIDKRCGPDFFLHLRRAGFRHLRFGVDGWSLNALRLQRKGYNTRLVKEVLRSSRAANIWTTVNIVVGVPGETEEDIDEAINNLTACKDYICMVESFNGLVLAAGGDYYASPEEYNIKFVGDREQICKENPAYIPSDKWYSERPYIDGEVRKQRISRIRSAIGKNGVKIGGFAENVLKDYLTSATVDNAKALTIKSVDKLRSITCLEAVGFDGYEVYESEFGCIAVQKSLRKIAIAEEKIGARDLLPYITVASSEREAALKLRAFEKNIDIDRYNMIHAGDRVIAHHKCIPKGAIDNDLLGSWELSPYIIHAPTMEALRAKLTALSSS